MAFVVLFWSWAPVFLWAILIYYFSSIPSLDTGWGVWDLILRKGAHVIEFGVLNGFLIRAFRRTWTPMRPPFNWIWPSLLSILYAISDEIHQIFVPGRGPSAVDVVIDSIGIGLIVLIFAKGKVGFDIKLDNEER